ncbi:DUF4913 domain-containing protein [Streptomyces sp. NRRL WC-3742]|uniref:DUF4913 domain-containing protein n=1 Tax=Streptomyces sp. NRRL WC-3742 TaxID=1463934 RepID=UPI0007C4D7A6|nr:DUF4913 domain-containing protein [Streptomyces sp. NRRL WC-3742]
MSNDESAQRDLDDWLEPEPEEAVQTLLFTSLDSFVREYLVVMLAEHHDGRRGTWCRQWWRHPDAVARLATMWRSFEYLSADAALGLSTWWTQHADPHLAVLRDPDTGAFAGCAGGHVDPEPLPVDPAPDELMSHPAFSLIADRSALTPEAIRHSQNPWLDWIAYTHPNPPPLP